MYRKFSRLLPLVLFAGLAACEDSTTSPERAGLAEDGSLTLLLTDAPGDFHAAVVTISEIRLHGDGDDVLLLDEDYTVDLLDLRNEVATLIQDFDVPAGAYTELRLIVDGAYIEVETEDGTRIYASSPDYEGLPDGVVADGTLHMPSMGQSGLKVKLPGGQLELGEDDTVVLIDFDVEESFGHQAGRSGRWVMHPVIRATDVTFGGNVLAELQLGNGVVLPELAGALLTLADFDVRLTPVGGGDALTGELSDTDGDGIYEFMFKGLVPGEYALAFVGPAGLLVSFSPVLPITVDVFERETTTETVTLSSAVLASSVTATLRLADGVSLPVVGADQLTLADFDAHLTPDGGEAVVVAFTDANADGTFEAAFDDLTPGEYTLTLVSPSGVTVTYDVAVPVDITLAEGAVETHAFVVTEASAS